MAESKRTFQAAKIERDLDERLIQPGAYRDALNISVASSEDANVGSLENLAGNNLIDNIHADITQDIIGLSSTSNPNAKVIGTYPHPSADKIYYFITGDNFDGIFEYDIVLNKVNTIIIDGSQIDSSAGSTDTVDTIKQRTFAFEDAGVVAAVNIKGKISVIANLGQAFCKTNDFNEYVSTDTVRTISVEVKVPEGFSNTDEFVFGNVTATQKALSTPSVFIEEETLRETTSVTLNGGFEQNQDITEIGFYYAENTGGSTTYEYFSNKYEVSKAYVYNNRIVLPSVDWSEVPSSDITVLDSSNAEIAASNNWEYIQGEQGNPSVIKVLSTTLLDDFPLTIGQTSTKTTITDGLSQSEIIAANNKEVVTNVAANVVSPFSKAITGLTIDTKYTVIAYAVNSTGTGYSNILNFTTKSALENLPVLSTNELYIVPNAGNSTQALTTIGYGDYYTSTNGFCWTVFSPANEWGKSSYVPEDVTIDIETVSGSGGLTVTQQYVGLATEPDPVDLTGSYMSGTWRTSGSTYPQGELSGLNPGDSLEDKIGGTISAGFRLETQTDGTTFRTQLGGLTAFSGGEAKAVTIEWGNGAHVTLLADEFSTYGHLPPNPPFYSYRFYYQESFNLPIQARVIDAKGVVPADGTTYQIKEGYPVKERFFKGQLQAGSTSRVINVTASAPGFKSKTIQMKYGTPSSTYTSNFTLNYSTTGVGDAIKTAKIDTTNFNYNTTSNLASYSIGPYLLNEFKGSVLIPICNDDNVNYQQFDQSLDDSPGTVSSFENFDPAKLTVNITGKTEGTDYTYSILKEAPSNFGSGIYAENGYFTGTNDPAHIRVPAILLSANPYTLNDGTATVSHQINITYNY